MHSTFQGTYFRNHSAGVHPKAVRDVCFFNQRISGCLFLSPHSDTPSLNEASESEGERRCGPPSHSQAPAAIYLLILLLRCQSPPLVFFLLLLLFLKHPVSQSVSNYQSQRQMFGESFGGTESFRRLSFPPPPVRFQHLWRPLPLPPSFQNVFNC